MIKFWVLGMILCFLLYIYIILHTRKQRKSKHPLVYDLILGIIGGIMCSILSWVGVMLLLSVLSIKFHEDSKNCNKNECSNEKY